MAKEAYYFSHDSNARHDPKIGAMRSVYGSEGYGWFWILVEMMRESEGYRLDMHGKYIFNAYAKQMDTECNTAVQFVRDCINEFELFGSDGNSFWSESLNRRMQLREETSEKRRAAANKRWSKPKKDANDMQMHSNSIANGMQGKERKGKEIKVNEIKEEIDIQTIPPSDDSIKDSLLKLITKNQITAVTIYGLDQIYSFIGTVDIEVIETAINKSTGKAINYAVRTLQGMISDGVKKKEQLVTSGKVTNFRGSNKPAIPTVVNESINTKAATEEEMNELRELARRLDASNS